MTSTLTRRLVSLAEAADALAVSTRTVRRYIADGQLDAVRLGRKTLRIKLDSLGAIHRRQTGRELASVLTERPSLHVSSGCATGATVTAQGPSG